MDKLFVYGTLRPGSSTEEAAWLAANARLVGAAQIRGRLFRVTHYPALTAPLNHDQWVRGDVFDGVTAAMLERLDTYEGAEYERQPAEVTMEDGTTLTAYLYRYVQPTDELELLPSGDWTLP